MKSDLIPRFLSCVRAATFRSTTPALILFSALFLAGSAYGQSAPGFQAPDKPKVKDDTPAAVKAARGEVPFNQIYGHLKVGASKTKRLGQLSQSELEQKDDKFLRIGVVRTLEKPLDPRSDSELYTVSEGYIRVAGIVSEGAVGVRVQFKDLSLPPGARVFVYSVSNPNEFYGPYVGRGPSDDGTFWTPAVRGDTVVIEYFTPAKNGSAKAPFEVNSIAHVYKDMSEDNAAGSCNLEVTPEWQNVAKSVGRIDFVSGNFIGTCTGTLLNNLANDQKPYFLTANHCVSTQSEAQSVTVYWNYNTGDDPPGGTPTTHGASVLATGTTSDFTLLRLTGTLPGGLFFSGWDSSTFSNSTAGAGIHHPDGSHKRISFGTARQPSSGNCPTGTQCLRVDWSSGVTEPGSSGSGVWIGSPSDPNGPRLIGNLIGGLSSCGGAPSDMWDVYGRFSVTYPSISTFLDGSACVNSLSTTSQSFTSSGGAGSFNVNAAGSCNWTAVSSNSFVTITSGASGSGNGTVNFSVAANTGSQRSATIAVGGQVFNITQGGQPRTLTIASSSPNSGISVTLFPADNNGQTTGTTPFTATYDEFKTVTLNAQGSAGGDTIFVKWLKDGADSSNSPVTTVTMDVNHTMTAVYGPTPTFVLTVNSTNPNSGVPIAVTPNDDGGLGNGTTQFTRTYKHFTTVQLTAPISVGGNNYFLKWQKNGVDLTNTRTTSVNMGTNHTMTAVYTTLPVPPAPTPTPTPSGPGQAIGYQINPTHTGSQFDTVSPPLTQRWSRDLGNSVSYPLIVNGRVYVIAGVLLYALDGTTGGTLWGPIEIGVSRGLAYDSGRVFAVNDDGLLRAFDAATGTQAWSRELSGQLFSSPPSAMDGTVYVNGYPTIHAVSAQDGSIKWSTLNAGGFQSSPAVTPTAIYVSYSCDVYSLSPSTGAIIWRLPSSCGGGGGRTPVYYNSRLYVRNNDLGHLAIDAATGIPVAEIEALAAPAFHGSTGFFLNISTLEAREVTSGTLKWSFTGDGTLSSAPLVVNGVVYVGSTSGKLYALDENTGTNVWTGTVGASVNRPDEHNLSTPLNGLGAGEGLIVVPASNLLVAYQAAGVSSTPMIYVEEGTNNAAALDSVTFVRGPFRKSNPNNFSTDQRTRLILLTSNLGLSQADLSDPSVLVVELAGVNLPVENVGPALIPGLSSSYIVIRLPDNVPTGPQELRVKLRGVASDARLLNISP